MMWNAEAIGLLAASVMIPTLPSAEEELFSVKVFAAQDFPEHYPSHCIALVRLQHDQHTKNYASHRSAEGLSKKQKHEPISNSKILRHAPARIGDSETGTHSLLKPKKIYKKLLQTT